MFYWLDIHNFFCNVLLFYPLGEAAGLALGLVMLGSKNAQAIEDMVGYAQETQHEKILRGLAVGIALVMYGRMEEADALIESLCRDKVRSLSCPPSSPHPPVVSSIYRNI